jgi:hypothetical protein
VNTRKNEFQWQVLVCSSPKYLSFFFFAECFMSRDVNVYSIACKSSALVDAKLSGCWDVFKKLIYLDKVLYLMLTLSKLSKYLY